MASPSDPVSVELPAPLSSPPSSAEGVKERLPATQSGELHEAIRLR